MEATLRVELRTALRRRGLPTREVEGRADQATDAWAWRALTEEAVVPLFVRRHSGSRPGGLALTDDAGTIGWIVVDAERSRT